MIREFHDEITRLRAELEKYGGGNLLNQENAVMNEDGEMAVSYTHLTLPTNREV